MEIRAALVAHGQSAKATQPRQGAFDDPAMPTEAFAGVDAPPSDARDDAARATSGAAAREVIALVGVQLGGTVSRPTTSTARLPNRHDRIQGDFEHFGVVHIGRREGYRERDACSVDHKMALRARFAAIRRIRADRFAPLLAGTLAESSEARDQSSFSASARRCSNSWCKRLHTPACCQSRNRRQQVIPLPHPISWGSSSQPMPLFNTNRIPVSAARSGIRGRPPLALGGSGGSSGSMTAHSSSLTSALLMPPVYHPFC